MKELRELQLIEAPNDSNLEDCESDLAEYDSRIAGLEERIKEQRAKSELESPEYRKIVEDLGQARQRLLQRREEAEHCKVTLQNCDALKENGQRAIDELQRGLEDCQRKLERNQMNKSQIQQRLQEQLDKAESLLKERPKQDIDVKALRRSLDALLKFIETNKNVYVIYIRIELSTDSRTCFYSYFRSYDVQRIKERLEGVLVNLDTFGFIVEKQEKLINVMLI